jgi:hypothetical protein
MLWVGAKSKAAPSVVRSNFISVPSAGKFRGIEQLLGEWGFEVNTSPVKKKE